MPLQFMSKQQRQDMVMDIIRTREVKNQLELIRVLEERGVAATQSSISRDIHDLSIAKMDGRYVVAVLPVPQPSEGTTEGQKPGRAHVTSLTPAGPNLLVVRSSNGGATSFSLSIDRARWPEVLGTVASDDTIFIATAGKREQLRLMARLEEFTEKPAAAPIQVDPLEDRRTG
jgi:transcriptional regulator of arginine metabolism